MNNENKTNIIFQYDSKGKHLSPHIVLMYNIIFVYATTFMCDWFIVKGREKD